MPSRGGWGILVKAKEEVGKLLLSENQTSASTIPAAVGSGSVQQTALQMQRVVRSGAGWMGGACLRRHRG